MENYYPQMMKDVQSALWTASCTKELYLATRDLEKELFKQSGLTKEQWEEVCCGVYKMDDPARIPPHLREELGSVHLTVVYETYERYEQGSTNILHITAGSVREALDKMLQRVGLYVDSLEELEEGAGYEMTIEDIMKYIDETSGDGCDFIFSIKNDDTGEEYRKSNFFEEENI